MVLVDSSSWIHALRPDGDPQVRARLDLLVRGGSACWCPLVRLELWNGAAGERDRKSIRALERLLPELAITAEVWDLAYDLARKLRAKGITVPGTDILIAACARHHAAEIESADADFEHIAKV